MDDFVAEENRTDNTVLMIDLHNMIFRNLFPAAKQDPLDYTFQYWKYLTLNGIIKHIRMFNPNKVVLAIDSSNHWRKEIYPHYKAHRAEQREKSKVNFEKFWPVLEEFLTDLKSSFQNFSILKIDGVEADDIIAVMTSEYFKNSKIINVSTDTDFYQLFKFKNYNQYDPIKKKFVEHVNPDLALNVKILMGDKADNIPACSARIGKKTAHSLFLDGIEERMKDDDFRSQYNMNKQLIDFTMIPKRVSDKIINTYENYTLNTYNGGKVFNFMIKHKQNYFLENLDSISNTLKKI